MTSAYSLVYKVESFLEKPERNLLYVDPTYREHPSVGDIFSMRNQGTINYQIRQRKEWSWGNEDVKYRRNVLHKKIEKKVIMTLFSKLHIWRHHREKLFSRNKLSCDIYPLDAILVRKWPYVHFSLSGRNWKCEFCVPPDLSVVTLKQWQVVILVWPMTYHTFHSFS